MFYFSPFQPKWHYTDTQASCDSELVHHKQVWWGFIKLFIYISCLHCAVEHLGGQQQLVVGYRSHMAMSVGCITVTVLCVVFVSIHSFDHGCQQLLTLKVLKCVTGELICGFHENWRRDARGSVATGAAVSTLLLDDDSLIIAGVVRRLHCLFILLPLTLRVGRDAHTRFIRLWEHKKV